jgi:hypothetical protein
LTCGLASSLAIEWRRCSCTQSAIRMSTAPSLCCSTGQPPCHRMAGLSLPSQGRWVGLWVGILPHQ